MLVRSFRPGRVTEHFAGRAYKLAFSSDNKWLATYRLLIKRAPVQPQLAIDMASIPLMLHSYQFDVMYPCAHYRIGRQFPDRFLGKC